ncbi:Intracellular PHB depolymerase (plasmid) [Cupriavidus necator H850]|uniref:polyhydroxyalkanoate depolymerase n=1 Tax=Cupriavidus necator TaxID=106590 RepID=UPI00129DBCA2|nr:polyhydroxyalkanoate depolymerase [Cupriavidus necator]KAI3604125.1 Intracellular PHB depolymerase [Cupriavidus necator H850]
MNFKPDFQRRVADAACPPLAALAIGAHRATFAQAYRLFQAAIGVLGPPAFGLTAIEHGGEVVPVEERVVSETPFCSLRCFSTRIRGRPMRMLCAPLAGHRAVLLREAIASMLADADVCVTDWMDARDVPAAAGQFRLDDYVRMLEDFMRRLGPAGLDVVAVCQATVPALAAAARLAAAGEPELRTLVLIGGPVDARLHPTMLGRIAATMSPQVFLQACTGPVPPGYPGAGRIVYPGFLQLPTLASGQPDRMLSLMLGALAPPWAQGGAAVAESRAAATDFAAMIDMPAEFILDTMRTVFREHLLPQGRWYIQGEQVRPGAMRTTRLLTVEGERDTITGAGQTHAAHKLCSALPDACRIQATIPACDHYGLFSGPPWRHTVFPPLRHWLNAPARAAASAGVVDASQPQPASMN